MLLSFHLLIFRNVFEIRANAATATGGVVVNVGADYFNDAVECLVAFGIVEEVGIDGTLEVLFVGVEEGIVGGSAGGGGGWMGVAGGGAVANVVDGVIVEWIAIVVSGR